MTAKGSNNPTANTETTYEDERRMLHMQLDNYLDGLLAHEEIVQMLPRIRAKTPELAAHPRLSEAFTKTGLESLLVRVAMIQNEVGTSQTPPTWFISENGSQITGNLMLRGDQVDDSMVPSDQTDFCWIHPSVSFDLPENVIHGEILPAPFRKLSVVDGILMTASEAETIIEMRKEGGFLI